MPNDRRRSKKRFRGDFEDIGPVEGTGLAEDPFIHWLVQRPSEGRYESYQRAVRTAARVTGCKVWYIRSLIHWTTRDSGETMPDDPHFTVFADSHVGEPQDQPCDYSGHLYVRPDKINDPERFLHPTEFQSVQDGDPFPIWLIGKRDYKEYKYPPDDGYELFQNYEDIQEEEDELQYVEETAEGGDELQYVEETAEGEDELQYVEEIAEGAVAKKKKRGSRRGKKKVGERSK